MPPVGAMALSRRRYRRVRVDGQRDAQQQVEWHLQRAALLYAIQERLRVGVEDVVLGQADTINLVGVLRNRIQLRR